jgi:hypothetical protein
MSTWQDGPWRRSYRSANRQCPGRPERDASQHEARTNGLPNLSSFADNMRAHYRREEVR